jgi:hypothetical protein
MAPINQKETLTELDEKQHDIKNAVFWDVTLRGSCKNRRFGGTYLLHHQGEKNKRDRNNVGSN